MKLFGLIILILLLVVPQSKIFGQANEPFPAGLGIEFGGGQNNLFWSAPTGDVMMPGMHPIDRTHFFLTPNIRINYNFHLSTLYSTMIFAGYNRLGGSSDKEDGFQSKYLFDGIEVGSFFLVNIENLKFGLGLKVNYSLKMQFQYISPSDSYYEDRSDIFTKWSGDVGIRLMYLFSHLSIGFESWFGLNDLRNTQLIGTGGSIRENHYRFLIGYVF